MLVKINNHIHTYGECLGFGATCFTCGKPFDDALKEGDFNREKRLNQRYENLMYDIEMYNFGKLQKMIFWCFK